VLTGGKDGRVMLVNVGLGEVIKTVGVGRGPVIEMAVFERRNKKEQPIIMTCCNGDREMFLTKIDSGLNEAAITKTNVSFGCGIGPKLVISHEGVLGLVSQSANEKQVDLYQICVK
jgi:hypothetical protein